VLPDWFVREVKYSKITSPRPLTEHGSPGSCMLPLREDDLDKAVHVLKLAWSGRAKRRRKLATEPTSHRLRRQQVQRGSSAKSPASNTS